LGSFLKIQREKVERLVSLLRAFHRKMTISREKHSGGAKMIRKLAVTLLVGLISLLGILPVLAQEIPQYNTLKEFENITGRKIEKFNEAPMLRTKVAAGELPPVEERLPEEPKVIKPLEEIGQYGGTLNVADLDPFNAIEARELRRRGLFKFSNDCTKVLPDAAKGYELSEDKKTLTIYLRKGLKWSDGVPFTVDDILFWWEDVMLNKELTPIIGKFWKPGGELMRFEKVDDYTLRLHFAIPYSYIMSTLGHSWCSGQMNFYDPKHYLKKYHIKYNPKANELAKKEGFDYWWQAYNAHKNPGYYRWNLDVDLPVIDAYVIKKVTPSYQIWERNPYFWEVDTAGNQLPYIDRIVGRLYENREILIMKAIAGDLDLCAFHLLVKDYPLLKENEKKGNYRTEMWKCEWGSAVAFAPNQNHPDPVMRKINRDIRFRQALSLAINREEINEVVCFGLGTPRQATVVPSCSYYKEEWGKSYAEYNPQKANKLLDEMGLKWNETREYRLRPDGKPLSIVIEYYPGEGPKTEICELVKEYWEKIGIKVALKPEDRGLYNERILSGTLDLGIWHLDCTTELFAYSPYAKLLNFGSNDFAPNIEWQKWWNTSGEKGEEPPEEVKRLFKDADDWFSATTKEEYIRLAQRIFDWHAKHLFYIGTVGMPPWPVIAKNNLRNVPAEAWWGWDSDFWVGVDSEQFFFKK